MALRVQTRARRETSTETNSATHGHQSHPFPVFASGSPTGPARVRTTQLATIVVHVDDPAVRRGPLGDLMGVVLPGDACADIEELPDAGVGREVAHHPAEQGTVGADIGPHAVKAGLASRFTGTPAWSDHSALQRRAPSRGRSMSFASAQEVARALRRVLNTRCRRALAAGGTSSEDGSTVQAAGRKLRHTAPEPLHGQRVSGALHAAS